VVAGREVDVLLEQRAAEVVRAELERDSTVFSPSLNQVAWMRSKLSR
jgi:hypothetical protein